MAREEFVLDPAKYPLIRLLRLQGQHGLSSVALGVALLVSIINGSGVTIPVWQLGVWSTVCILVGLFQVTVLLINWNKGRAIAGGLTFLLWVSLSIASVIGGSIVSYIAFFSVPTIMSFFEALYNLYRPVTP